MAATAIFGTVLLGSGGVASASGYNIDVTLKVSGELPKGTTVDAKLFRPVCVTDENRQFKTEVANATSTYKWSFHVENGGSCGGSGSNLDYLVYFDGNSAWGMRVDIRQFLPRVFTAKVADCSAPKFQDPDIVDKCSASGGLDIDMGLHTYRNK